MRIFLLLIVSCLPFTTKAQDIAVSYFYSQLPPYEFVDDNGEAAGKGIKKVIAIFKQAQLNYHFHYYSINKGISLLQQAKIDFSTVISPNQNIYNDFLVSDNAIYTIELGVIHHKETSAITEISQLNHSNYAALKETSFLFNKISSVLQQQNRYNVNSFKQGVHLVKANKLPYFLTYHHSEEVLAHNITFNLLITEPVYLIISKLHPQASSLMQKINQAVAQLNNK